MAQNQNHRGRSEVMREQQVMEFSGAGLSGLVLGNKKSAGLEAVASSVARQVVSIRAAGRNRVVAILLAGFGRASGGTSIQTSAAHITNRSSSFRPSASTGRG